MKLTSFYPAKETVNGGEDIACEDWSGGSVVKSAGCSPHKYSSKIANTRVNDSANTVYQIPCSKILVRGSFIIINAYI